MNLIAIILLVVLVLLLFGGGYGYRAGWGVAGQPYYGPGIGIVGIVLIVLLVLLLTGRL
jgi:uncharacterized membrane protein